MKQNFCRILLVVVVCFGHFRKLLCGETISLGWHLPRFWYHPFLVPPKVPLGAQRDVTEQGLLVKTMNSACKNDEFCIKNGEFCI